MTPEFRERLILTLEAQLGDRIPRLSLPYRHKERREIARTAVEILLENGEIFRAAIEA